MKIALCASTKFYDQLPAIRDTLINRGYEVLHPERREQRKTGALLVNLFPKIESADAVLGCNFEKNGTDGYVGGNMLVELAHAFYHGKKIFLLNPVPAMSYSDEIRAMNPIIVGEDLSGLR